LATKQLESAAIDVYSEEPLAPNSRLLSMENLILTPHAAGISLDIPDRTCQRIAEEIALFLSGKRPKNIFNPEALDEVS